MQTLTLKQLAKYDDAALSSIIDYWKDYEPKTVLLAYAELKARNYFGFDRLQKKQKEFCFKHNCSDCDTFLNRYLDEIGYASYNEYYEKELGVENKNAYTTQQQSQAIPIQQQLQSQNSAAVTMGYIFSFMPLIIVPIIFMPLAIVCGITSLFQGKVGHGLAIIFLAIVTGCIGASIGGWGLGLPKLGGNYY